MKSARLATLWVILVTALVVALGFETRWGTSLRRGWQGVDTPPAAPVRVAVLPDFKLDGPLEQMPETTARTLFTPTRRPAPAAPPPQPPEPPKPTMKRGQFALLGTSIAGDRKTAIFREVASGKVHRVGQGGALNEFKLTDVKADRVVLTFAGDSEELQLRVATGRPAIAPGMPRVVPGMAVPGAGQVDPAQAPARARRRDVPAGMPAPAAAPVPVPGVPQSANAAPQAAAPAVNAGGQRFLQPPQEAPSVQAAREAAAAAEWRALEQQIKERQGLVGGR